MENKETATPRRILELIKEAFNHYKKKRLTIEQLEEFLVKRHGMTTKKARELWFKAYKKDKVIVGLAYVNGKLERVIELKTEEDEYEIWDKR